MACISLSRRRLLRAAGAAPLAAWLGPARAQQRRPQTQALLVGVATSLHDSGFALHIRRAIARDTGLAVDTTPGPSERMLALLEQGEVDVAITHAPQAEEALLRQGLVHDRRFVASNRFVLAGPLERPASPTKGRKALPPRDPLGLAGGVDVAAALARLAQAGAQGQALFLAPAERTGARAKERSLWQAAGLEPQGPWYLRAVGGMAETLAQANERGAYVLVDRGVWLASRQREGLGIVVEGDARLADLYHAMRSFRVNHPAGKLFLDWLTGPTGRRAVSSAPGGYGVTPPRG
ncbi:MAG: substrate-binding domain-containing protein [Caldimonas sp.]|uniref:substrate-binding domain-containing protein n=1 Tax=Caldimonas sp. TaxID=2838790 RepID=UPI00391CA958